MKSMNICVLIFVLFFCFFSFLGKALSIVWSGSYRMNGTFIENLEMLNEGKRKSYVSHHFVLKPKIVVQDSVRLYSRLDFFNASSHPSYLNSILGYRRGSNFDEENAIRVFGERSVDFANSQLQINHLYLIFMHEFGSLILGRVPLNFGLGLTHNAGEGLFHDWLDNRDVIAYKIVTDRFTLMPMIGKISEGMALDVSDDIPNILFHGQYESFDTNLILGLFYEWRRVSRKGNDAAKNYEIIQSPLSSDEILNALEMNKAFTLNKFNFYISKKTSFHSFKLEGGFQWGSTGLRFPFESDSQSESEEDNSLEDIKLSGFGLALQYKLEPKTSFKWNIGFWGGMAQGDDSSTRRNYEFYAFDRNYDVAFLLFNHPLSTKDLLKTRAVFRRGEDSRTNTVNTEALSNAFYFSPRSRFYFFKKWSAELVATGAWLWENFSPSEDRSNKKRTLGFELDVNLLFEPNENLIWKTQIGLLIPGSAFKECDGCGTSFSYGASTKVGVRF